MTYTTFTITDPDGREHSRTSKTRRYTHAVVATSPEGKFYFVHGWCGSLALAEKLANSARNTRYPMQISDRSLRGQPIYDNIAIINAR